MVVVEDGSQDPCLGVVELYMAQLNISYFVKSNTGPGDSRNFGMTKARGDFFVFFDSDCIIPENYFIEVEKSLQARALDAYGGPDAAHESFSPIQKAIDYAMTSVLTTGGIRGRARQLDRFQPRSFNMGVARKVYERVGGFIDLHPGEDPDWSYRIQEAGFKTGFIAEASVFHKRRIDFKKFISQVYKFGVARTILMKLHPQARGWVYALPSMALVVALLLFLGGIFNHYLWWPLLTGALILLIHAVIKTGNFRIALLALVASGVQIAGYGWGYLRGMWSLHWSGKEVRKQFPSMFFNIHHQKRED